MSNPEALKKVILCQLETAVATGGTMMASESNFNSMRDILGIPRQNTGPASHEDKETKIPSDLLACLLRAQLDASAKH